jgi:hypothetical protein
MPPELLSLLELDLPLHRRDPHYFLPTTGDKYLLFGSDREATRQRFIKFFSQVGGVRAGARARPGVDAAVLLVLALVLVLHWAGVANCIALVPAPWALPSHASFAACANACLPACLACLAWWLQEDWQADQAMQAELEALRQDVGPTWLQARTCMCICGSNAYFRVPAWTALPMQLCAARCMRAAAAALHTSDLHPCSAAAAGWLSKCVPDSLPAYLPKHPTMSRSQRASRRRRSGMCAPRCARPLWTCAGAPWQTTWNALASAVTC